MTKRFLTTTTAALTMVIAGAIGAQAENEASVTEQAAQAVDAIGDTAYAIGETATDTAQAGIEAVGADEIYSDAADVSAQLDAAITNDAIVRSSDGEIVGTVKKSEMDRGFVVIDLDGEMEGADERAIENASVRASQLSLNADEELVIDMTKAEFAAALNDAVKVRIDAKG